MIKHIVLSLSLSIFVTALHAAENSNFKDDDVTITFDEERSEITASIPIKVLGDTTFLMAKGPSVNKEVEISDTFVVTKNLHTEEVTSKRKHTSLATIIGECPREFLLGQISNWEEQNVKPAKK